MIINPLHNTGKVTIGSAWEDPTILNPILRRLPPYSYLHVPKEPSRWVPEVDTLVVYVCVLAYAVVQAYLFLKGLA